MHLEKKYLVDSLAPYEKMLAEKGIKKSREVISTHYYGQHDGNNVEKFVEYPDRCEIHVLESVNGQFRLSDHRIIKDRQEGFAYLKSRGYEKANIVTMEYTEYPYHGGLIGLYLIDTVLPSVILDYPEGQHGQIETEFALTTANEMQLPYNKYLDTIGKLRSITLE